MALDGKIALVTGAGRGIGEATAIELAKAGADVAVTDLDEDAADETSAKIGSLGRRGLAIRADIGDLSDIDAMVGTVAGELGGSDNRSTRYETVCSSVGSPVGFERNLRFLPPASSEYIAASSDNCLPARKSGICCDRRPVS